MSEKKSFELKKMWQWLVYLYLVLPGLLFFLGVLTRNMDLGVMLPGCSIPIACMWSTPSPMYRR